MTGEQDTKITEQLLDAFRDPANASAPSAWPAVLNRWKKKIEVSHEWVVEQ